MTFDNNYLNVCFIWQSNGFHFSSVLWFAVQVYSSKYSQQITMSINNDGAVSTQYFKIYLSHVDHFTYLRQRRKTDTQAQEPALQF